MNAKKLSELTEYALARIKALEWSADQAIAYLSLNNVKLSAAQKQAVRDFEASVNEEHAHRI